MSCNIMKFCNDKNIQINFYFGKVKVEHPSATKASLVNGVTNEAFSEAYTRSTRPRIVTATPIAWPLTPTATNSWKEI